MLFFTSVGAVAVVLLESVLAVAGVLSAMEVGVKASSAVASILLGGGASGSGSGSGVSKLLSYLYLPASLKWPNYSDPYKGLNNYFC
jgi:hypothetical protein